MERERNEKKVRSEEEKPRPQLGKLAYAKIPTEFISFLFFILLFDLFFNYN